MTGVTPAVLFLDVSSGITSASVALASYYLCNYLETTRQNPYFVDLLWLVHLILKVISHHLGLIGIKRFMKDDDGQGGDDQHVDNNCEKEKIFLQTLSLPGFSFMIKKKQIFL